MISNINLAQPHLIAAMSLGSGKNLPFDFGWVRWSPKFVVRDVFGSEDVIGSSKDVKEMKVDMHA